MKHSRSLARCASCDGFGWFDDGLGGDGEECDWCAGAGYVYREGERDSVIPRADYADLAEELEALELERLRELGYQGQAKQPWQQRIRKDTQLGRNPYGPSEDD